MQKRYLSIVEEVEQDNKTVEAKISSANETLLQSIDSVQEANNERSKLASNNSRA